jgi:hypothetical protein
MTTSNSKGSTTTWIDGLPPEELGLLDMLTPTELEALRRNGEEARKFGIAEFGLDDDEFPSSGRSGGHTDVST